jgi:hypothetical protein
LLELVGIISLAYADALSTDWPKRQTRNYYVEVDNAGLVVGFTADQADIEVVV